MRRPASISEAHVPRRVHAGLGVALLCLLLCACTNAAPAATGTAVSATPSRSAAAQSSAPAAIRTPTPGAISITATIPAAPQVSPGAVLLQTSGDNPPGTNCCTVSVKSNGFSAPGSWDINWNYDCSRLGRAGNLNIDAYRADGSFISMPPSINQVGSGGQGVQSYTQAGGFYLVVNSVCRWSAMVVTSGRPTSTPGPAAQAGPLVTQAQPALISAIPTPPTSAGIAITVPGAASAPVAAATPAAPATLVPGAPAGAAGAAPPSSAVTAPVPGGSTPGPAASATP